MLYTELFSFLSGGGVDNVLLRLPLIELVIKDGIDVHFIQSQTSTDISRIVNGFVQYVQNYFQYVYIPI